LAESGKRSDKIGHYAIAAATAAEHLATRFLDPDLFYRMRLEVPKVDIDITAAVADLVGGISDIQATANLYFETVHTWMPILSKKLFFSNLLYRLSHRRAETFLLILSMRLCSAQVTTPRTRLYRTVKQLYAEIEASGALSFQVLQAAILIALYEMGHSVYPAAFLSVGLCARYATTLGINTNPVSIHAKKLPWLEEEEHRRVWWSLAILDRFVLHMSK
jgi:hypothetical protein